MLNIDANTSQGLAQLSPAVKSMLTAEMMTVLDRLIDAPDPALIHQLQGRARLLRELLQAIEHAEQPKSPHRS